MKECPSGIKLSIVVSVFFLMVSCYSPQAQEVKTEIDISLPVDIPVIYNQKNPEPPPGVPSKIILEEELCLRFEKKKKGDFPSSVGNAAVDDEGNFFVFDNEEKKVKVFDRNGQLVRTFGEFEHGMGYMQIVEGKTIMIYSWGGKKRMYFYTTEGLYLKEISAEKYHRVLNPLIDSKGNIIAEFRNYKRRPRRGDSERTYVHGLRKMNPNFNPIVTIATFEWTSIFDQMLTSVTMPRFTYKVRKDDSIVWGIFYAYSDYELYISNPDGKEIKKIVKDYDPEMITKEDKKGIPVYWPENFPPFRWIACDKQNEIYVQTYEKDENGRTFWDVFDPEGKYIAKFSLPKVEKIIGIKKDYMYTRCNEWKEIHYVKRYRVIRE
ncbi:MAG: hypothetical protein JSV96_00045 [Candidatus Aminicenantes bacterium]|nr:MAG: hypothetical protein JSV96_00045 [Candidatus Aminicenantes bacterium]